jgi:L-lysine exporter family protein LysE/ArgO
VCLCDTFLIVLGAVGGAAFLAVLGYPEILAAVGSVFLFVLGSLALRVHSQPVEARRLAPITTTVAQAVGVSMLNPHAILDTVGVLGAAIAAQAAQERVVFAAGAVAASWAWYLILSMGASTLQTRLTLQARLWIQRGSGIVMLVFACVLALSWCEARPGISERFNRSVSVVARRVLHVVQDLLPRGREYIDKEV